MQTQYGREELKAHMTCVLSHCFVLLSQTSSERVTPCRRSLDNRRPLVLGSYPRILLEKGQIDSLCVDRRLPALLLLMQSAVILGGAGIGSSVGLMVHYGRTVSGDPPPKIALERRPILP